MEFSPLAPIFGAIVGLCYVIILFRHLGWISPIALPSRRELEVQLDRVDRCLAVVAAVSFLGMFVSIVFLPSDFPW